MKKLAVLLVGIFILFVEGRSAPVDSPKLHITFNQPAYIPGDTAFFRGFLLRGNPLKRVPGRHVVNIKLLNKNSETLLFDRILFFDGVSNNQIVIPTDLSPGAYSIIAYSDEMMKFFDPSTFFQTSIIVSGKKETYLKHTPERNDSVSTSKSNADVNVEVKMQHEYGVREPVNLAVKINNANDYNLSDFSISVYKEQLFPSLPTTRFFESESGKSDKIGNQTPKPIYFSGKAYFSTTKKAVPDSTLITFYLNRQMVVYGLRTKKDGRFDFPLFMALEDDQVFYAMEYKGKLLKDVKISVADYSVQLKQEIADSVGSGNDQYTSFSSLKRTIMGSFNYFSNKSGKIQQPHVFDEEEFEVDYSVDLNKFKEFPTMEMTLHEIVPLVQCKPINGKTDVRVFMYTAMVGKRSPLYIIDGMMTDSTEYFLGLDPSQLSSIGVMRSESKLLKYGALGKNGILVVITKGISDNSVPISSSVLSITGVNKSHKFSAVDYKIEAKKVSRVPDLRTTLYWNPNVVTDQGGNAKASFYTGDVTGSFRVHIEGMTDDGNSFSYETRFSVSERKP